MNLSPENKYKDMYKLITVILGALSFIILLIMFLGVHHSVSWKQYQLAYRDSLQMNANDARAQTSAENLSIQIQQTTVDQLSY